MPDAEPGAPTPEVAEAVAAVKRYFEGEETDFSGLKLDLGEQDDFFKQIYAAARRIGWGHTTTYGALAKELGAGPEAARDVGQAMAKNPVALIIPCHRVLAAGGKVGGFSAPGGSAAKIRMLELEGVRIERPWPAQKSLDSESAISPGDRLPAQALARRSGQLIEGAAVALIERGKHSLEHLDLSLWLHEGWHAALSVVFPAFSTNVTSLRISSGINGSNGARVMPQPSLENEFSHTMRSFALMSR